MATTLSNLTLSNGEYSVTGSNPSGTLTIVTPTTSSFYVQYTPYIPASFLHDYTLTIKDTMSNVSIRLQGSNVKVTNATSNMCSIFSPYIQPNAFNTIGLNRYDNSVMVSVNSSNIVRVTSSNELPSSFSNSYIEVSASNAGKFKDITYQSVAVTNTAMTFTRPVKATTITASNVTSCNIATLCNQLNATSNVAYTLSNTLTPSSTFGSNTAVWSSNNLLNKAGGTISGNLGIGRTSAYQLDVLGNSRLNNTVIGDCGHGNTYAAFAHSNSFTTGSYALLSELNGTTYLNCGSGRSIAFRTNNTDIGVWNSTGLGVGLTNPSQKLDVSGVIQNKVTGGANATFTIGRKLICDATEAYWYWRNSNLGLDLTNPANNLASTKRNFIINEFSDSTCGFVGIGTSAPASKLDVAGNINSTTMTGGTITSLSNLAMSASNTATWASNNNINRTIDSISTLNTDKILLPASANLIGSGWDYTISGWTAKGPNGGYLFRNNNGGGLEIYTGKSNEYGMSATITSNGNLGLGTYTPNDRLTVAGRVRILGDGTNPVCLILSNNLHPGIQIFSSNASMEIAVASTNGAYSFDASTGDAVIRTSSNLYLQTKDGASAICVNSNNRVGIQTKNPVYSLHVAGTFFSSNAQGPTIDLLSNASFPAYYKSIWSSNSVVWTSNLATDTYYKSEWSSNNFGKFTTSNPFDPMNGCALYHKDITNVTTDYALAQFNNGTTIVNGGNSGGVAIREGNSRIAQFKNSSLFIGGDYDPTYTLDVLGDAFVSQGITTRRATGAPSGVFTHIPYTGDYKNYLRGDTIIADNGGTVGIGGANSSNQLSVFGTTYLSSLKVGGVADAFNAIKFYYATLGGSGGANKITYTFSGILPTNYEVFTSICGSDNTKSDCFCVSVVEKLSGSVKFVITRVDNTAWTQNTTLTMMFIGF